MAARHGGTVVRVPVGRQAAIDALAGYRPEQIAIAGEGTGAVMMPRFRFVYDGIASMLAILSLMRERGRTLSEIVAGYPRYSILKGQVPLAVAAHSSAADDVAASGTRTGASTSSTACAWSGPDRWFHVRVSQTEPIVRVICEQRGDPPTALFESLMEQVRGLG